MKESGQCPKCLGRELYVVSPVRQRVIGSNDAAPVPVVATNLAGREDVLQAGSHGLYICAACGFEEWYAENATKLLETLSAIPESGVRKLGAAHRGYR